MPTKQKTTETPVDDPLLGQYVRNRVSGVSGYVVTRFEYTGYTWYAVEPEGKNNDAGKHQFGDPHEWVVVQDADHSPIERPTAAPASQTAVYPLGAHLVDRVTGFEGIATMRAEHINRCWTYALTSRTLTETDTHKPVELSFHVDRLTTPAAAKPVATPAPSGTGASRTMVPPERPQP